MISTLPFHVYGVLTAEMSLASYTVWICFACVTLSVVGRMGIGAFNDVLGAKAQDPWGRPYAYVLVVFKLRSDIVTVGLFKERPARRGGQMI